MATTDTKPGFRLPWSTDRSESADPSAATPGPAADESSIPPQENETSQMIDAAPAAPDHQAAAATPTSAEPVHVTAPDPTPPSVARKPNKFMADLTKAMQAAAETAREESLSRLSADAKATIEGIHTESATEAADLRKTADDDVAAIREWSKAEIARIREETDERITHRKGRLEREIEAHAAEIEHRVERVQARVDAFEAEMAAFFERLLAEEDPTRFAAMAESLPEPPPFDGPMPEPEFVPPATAAEETPEASVEAAAEAEADPAEPATAADPDAGASDWGAAPDPAWGAAPDPVWGATPEATPEVSPGATLDTNWGADANATADQAAAPAPDSFGDTAADGSTAHDDPRLSALGLTPDFAAAEAEAAALGTTDDGSDEQVPEIADEAIAARIAGLVPEGDGAADASASTRVIVTGLISVASIAGFKRHLSRATGVRSVGVSSGPDGEFIFAVEHESDVALRDVVAALPGFGARVTGEAEGELTVAARDPESDG